MPVIPPDFSGRFLTGLHARSAYSEGAGPYRIVPDAIAVPKDIADVVRLVRWANETKTPLIPRGSGSGMPGGNVGSHVVVDLSLLSDIADIDTEARSVKVGAGVIWEDLSNRAAHLGLRLPPNPSSGRFCTIGGMVACNAAGSRSLRFGSIRKWVTGLELVTGEGEVVWLERGRPQPEARALTRLGEAALPAIHQRRHTIEAGFPKTTKNSAGYALDEFLKTHDLLDLIIGSEGTLGIVTGVELRLDPIPKAKASLLVALASLDELGDAVSAVLPAGPSACELLDRSFLEIAGIDLLPDGHVEAVLILEFEGNSTTQVRGSVGDAVRNLKPWSVHVETALTAAEEDRIWAIRHAASPKLAELPDGMRSLQIVEDGCVPVTSLGNYLARIKTAAQQAGIEIVAFGHAGDGHVHVNAIVDTTKDGFVKNLEDLLSEATRAVIDLHGTVSGEHGDGRLRTPLLPQLYGPEVMELFRLVKEAFDPQYLFNPGVIVDNGSFRSLAFLKVGRDAQEIPQRIAEQLRRLERQGGWKAAKLSLIEDSATE